MLLQVSFVNTSKLQQLNAQHIFRAFFFFLNNVRAQICESECSTALYPHEKLELVQSQ